MVREQEINKKKAEMNWEKIKKIKEILKSTK